MEQSKNWDKYKDLPYLSTGAHSTELVAMPTNWRGKKYQIVTIWGELAEAVVKEGINVQDQNVWDTSAFTPTAPTRLHIASTSLDQTHVAAWRHIA